MIHGLIHECERCHKMVLLKLHEVSHITRGDEIVILDRYVCDDCVKTLADDLRALLERRAM